MFSSFQIHTEDCNLAAVSHLLFGAEKIWFIINSLDNIRLKRYFNHWLAGPNLLESAHHYKNEYNCNNSLLHKLFWLSITDLTDFGIRVSVIRQKPGDIVVVPGNTYHSGYNTGVFIYVFVINVHFLKNEHITYRNKYCNIS